MQKPMSKLLNDSTGFRVPMWLRQATTAGFIFFFAKGLLWIAAASWIVF